MNPDNKHENHGKYGNDENHDHRQDHISHPSHNSHNSRNTPKDALLPPRGDYRTLHSFQKTEVIYDITFRFTHKFLNRGDRTIDQMIQAARSGKKNLLEGSKAGTTSKETEIKLTNVARASLEELLDDYLDYLRARDLRIWDKDSEEAQYVRTLGKKTTKLFQLPCQLKNFVGLNAGLVLRAYTGLLTGKCFFSQRWIGLDLPRSCPLCREFQVWAKGSASVSRKYFDTAEKL